MIKSITLTYRGPTPKAARKELNSILRKGFHLMGVYWHRFFRGKHFTEAGGRQYRYKKRRPSYVARKRRLQKHNDPLVWSGRSRMLSRVRRVRATATGGIRSGQRLRGRVRVTMPVRTLNLRPKGGRINLRDELTRVSAPEARRLAALFARYLTSRLKAMRTKTTKERLRIAA